MSYRFQFRFGFGQRAEKVQAFGVDASRLAFGNTIKKRADIQYFYEQGIRLYVTDSDADLNNIAQYAPGSKVFLDCRLMVLKQPIGHFLASLVVMQNV